MLPSDYADMGAQAVHSCKYLKKLIANGTRSGNARNHGRPARFSQEVETHEIMGVPLDSPIILFFSAELLLAPKK
jgi:hypothetical protein